MKIGRIIGIINGWLIGDFLLIRVDKLFIMNGYMFMFFYNCYLVIDEGNVIFFSLGDFGFGVFVVKGDGILGLLGIVFVFMNF